ncbi:MAG: protoporphyrinogen oxidase [Myxococcota bacterium]
MRVVVIGGGISGLAGAFRVRERFREAGLDLDLKVLEADSRPGGTIHTHRDDGWLVETGPNGFLDSKPGTLRLINALGVEARILPADHASKRRFLFVDGRLQELPTRPLAFFSSPVLPFRGRLRFLFEPFMRKGPEDETVAELGRRRIGRHAVERLLDPMVSGIFAGDVEKLSVTSAFPAVKALESAHGSLVRGMMVRARERRKAANSTEGVAGGPAGPGGHLNSLAGGMGELIEALRDSLGESLRASTPVTPVIEEPGSGYRVQTGTGERLSADVVISAAPAYAAASYLRPVDEELSSELSGIPYAPISVVAVGLPREQLKRPLDGFGFLIPSREKEKILGCLWTSSIYPGRRAPEGYVLTRTMVGGARQPELALLPDGELIDVVREAHARTMDLHWEQPAYLRISRYEQGIPQYPVGHGRRLERIDAARARHPGLFLTGNHLRGIGVNDCCADAEAVANGVVEHALKVSASGREP